MNKETSVHGIGFYLTSVWLGLITAMWLTNPNDPLAQKVFAGHMLALAMYGIAISGIRLWHNAVARITAYEGFTQGDRHYRNDAHMTIDPTTGLVRQGYTIIVHDTQPWLRPLALTIGLLGMLWWQDLLFLLFT